MEYVVYVEDMGGKPLMPTKRFGKVRRMLKDGRAHVVCAKPFKIRLDYEPETKICQEIELGIDPGRTNIGYAAVNTDKTSGECGKCLMQGTLETRNKQIHELMKERAAHRSASRRGERLRRKRRAKKCGTTTEYPEGRMLPGYKKPLMLKDIINTEARFNNRKRPAGWVTPTVRQLIQTHVHLVELISQFVPVTSVAFEVNKFAFMELSAEKEAKEKEAKEKEKKKPNKRKKLSKKEYQHGPLFGYEDSNEAVYAVQNGRCLMCGKPIEHIHHIVPRHENGSDTLANKAGLCKYCHIRVHTDPLYAEQLAAIKKGLARQYAGTSALNQAIPYIVEELQKRFGGRLHLCTGYETKKFRDENGIEKTHASDAACIACSHTKAVPTMDVAANDLMQFRRHDRAIIYAQYERTYKYEGKVVAKNRKKRFEQKDPSLQDWFEVMEKAYGTEEAVRMRSHLKAVRSRRSYNNTERLMPGAIFYHNGKRHVMRGQQGSGRYLLAVGDKNMTYASKKCDLIKRNTGLVFV